MSKPDKLVIKNNTDKEIKEQSSDILNLMRQNSLS